MTSGLRFVPRGAARLLRRPHLRDPAKRDAYDRTHGIRATLEFRRTAGKVRYEEALLQLSRRRPFSATVGIKGRSTNTIATTPAAMVAASCSRRWYR